jgi:hypothetical protein
MPVREGREGSRWYNARPTSDDVASWFYSVPLHEGMSHSDYIGGLVMIQSQEKTKEVSGFDASGQPNIRDRTDLVYVPYVKVETRVAYFWKLCELREWTGAIEPVLPANADNLGLPPGFFKYAAEGPGQKGTVRFVGASMRVTVREKSRTESWGKTVMAPPPGTKITATATRWDVDENALMKAETGAIGRALGNAGMLVIPGSGVATAEDMLELQGPPAGATPDAAELPLEPAAPEGDDVLRARAEELVAQLTPPQRDAFQEWARGRKVILAEAQGSVLRGIVRKLEKAAAGE